MKILILGSGLLGVTTAYELARRGMEVTVLDRQPESARECSFANGGQLSYSTAEPLGTPHVLPKLPGWVFDSESPLVFRLRADWRMAAWGLRFLFNCTPERTRINNVNLLRLGLYSKRKMEALRRDTNIEFDFSGNGILHIFDTQEEFEHAKQHNAFQAKFGCERRVLGRDECLAFEPSLTHTARHIVGGLHADMDEVGDSYLYTNALAKHIGERYGVTFQYGVTIKNIRREGDLITGVETDLGDISADGYVMAMGSYSPVFLRKLGIRVPIYPMKGYSITLPATDTAPRVSVTDNNHKIVYTRIGDRLRVAGTAEFAGYDDRINDKRIAPILRAAKVMFPQLDWETGLKKWACLRSSTPDGPPILGPCRIRNLFLNTGHGTLGWTQVAGSAAIVADAIENKPPEILMQGLTVDRF